MLCARRDHSVLHWVMPCCCRRAQKTLVRAAQRHCTLSQRGGGANLNDWVLSDGSRADAVLTMHCNLAVAFKLLQGELKFIFVLGMCRLRGAQITAEFWFHEEDWEPHVLAAYVRHVAQSSGPGRSTTILATPSFHVEAGKIKAQLGATAFATARRYGID